MALTAVLSTPRSTVPAGYIVNCHIVVSNSGAGPVTISSIEPKIKSTPISFAEDKSSWTFSPVSLQANPVPAGGSQQFPLRVIFHGANNLGSYDVPNPNSTTYDLGCIIYGSDGSVVTPTALTITVTQNSEEI